MYLYEKQHTKKDEISIYSVLLKSQKKMELIKKLRDFPNNIQFLELKFIFPDFHYIISFFSL